MKARETNIGALTDMKSGQPEEHQDSLSFMDRLLYEISEGSNAGAKTGFKIGGGVGIIGAVIAVISDIVIAKNDPNADIGAFGNALMAGGITAGATLLGGLAGTAIGGLVGGLSQIAKEVGLTKKNLFTDNEEYMFKREVEDRATHINEIRIAKDNLQNTIKKPTV